MRCEDLDAQFADYLAGTLDPAVAADLTTHLGECAACAAEADALRETWHLLGAIPAARADSARLRRRVDAALTGYQQGIEHPDPNVTRASGSTRWGSWLAAFASPRSPGTQAAFAAAVLVLGVFVGRQTVTPSSPDPDLAALRGELQDMRRMVTLSLLQQQSASERLRGVTWTGQIEQPGNEVVGALLDTLMHDPNVNVRLASIDALKRFADHESVRRGAVDALSRQTSPLVQIALIDFVTEINGRESAGVLRRLSMDDMVDATVRARAESALRRLG